MVPKYRVVCGLFCSIASSLISVAGTGAEPAETLVKQALVAELGGDVALRRTLLDSAVSLSPEYLPARWHAGMVRIDDAWLSVADAEKRIADHGLVFEYRQLRDRFGPGIRGRSSLFSWPSP